MACNGELTTIAKSILHLGMQESKCKTVCSVPIEMKMQTDELQAKQRLSDHHQKFSLL